jgi:hypothetical protein
MPIVMCRKCNQYKHHSEFTTSAAGHASQTCDVCVAARDRQSSAARRRKARERHRRRMRRIDKRLANFNP